MSILKKLLPKFLEIAENGLQERQKALEEAKKNGSAEAVELLEDFVDETKERIENIKELMEDDPTVS